MNPADRQASTSLPLKLVASKLARNLLAELTHRYSAAGGGAVTVESSNGTEVAKRVQADENIDLVVLDARVIDQLMAVGKVLAGSRLDLMRSCIALAVRSDAPRPDISYEDAVRAAVLRARSVGYSSGPSGFHVARLLQRWGVADAAKGRVIQAPPGVLVANQVATGEVELGFQQLCELMNIEGIAVLGPMPDAIQSVTVFSAGIPTTSRRPDAARELSAALAAPGMADAKRGFGMDTVD